MTRDPKDATEQALIEETVIAKKSREQRMGHVVRRSTLQRIHRHVQRLEPIDRSTTVAWGLYGIAAGAGITAFVYAFGDGDPKRVVWIVLGVIALLCLCFGLYLAKSGSDAGVKVQRFNEARDDICVWIQEEMETEQVAVPEAME
jgi:hypothetical protein